MNLKQWIIATISLGVALTGNHGAAIAQGNDAPVIHSNASATCVMSPSGSTLGATAGDWTITCGDIGPGAGLTVISPPVADTAPVLMDVAPAPVADPVPVAEPAPDTTGEAVATDLAVASETDLDGDNYADALEWEIGLDASNPDTDGDGIADGDELPIYGTDPVIWDSDGDGRSDGEELFAAHTDPLVWDEVSADTSTETLQQETTSVSEQTLAPRDEVVPLEQTSNENLTATNGDAAALGTGAASAALGTGAASAAPGRVTRGGVSGPSLLGPDGTYSVTEISPSDVSVGETGELAPAPEPAPEAVVESVETVEPVVADTTVVAETDLDADNYADALELEIGLDPGNPDTDGDGVADGDEITIYGTDAFSGDTDGDGWSDGEELFAAHTDPLVWDASNAVVAESEVVGATG